MSRPIPRWLARTVGSPLALTVVVLSVVSIGMLIAGARIGRAHVDEDGPIHQALGDLRVEIATSHLWLEEYLTGDPAVDVERDVRARHAAARALTRALAEGGAAGAIRIPVPLAGRGLDAEVAALGDDLEAFVDLAEQRLAEPERAGIGSEIDQAYDAVFRTLLARAAGLRDRVRQRMLANQKRATALFATILVAWSGIVILALTGLVRLERRRAEAGVALERERAWLSTALGSLADAVVATGPAGEVTFLNQAAEDLTGWDTLEAQGRPLGEVCPLDVPPPAGRDAAGAAPIETVLRPRHGGEIPVEGTAAPLGAGEGTVVVLRDVRERKRAEAALRESEDRLRRSQKMEALGRLAGGLAHDVNNYLAAISTQCERIRLVHDDEALAPKIEAIERAVTRTSTLIRRLLAFSRGRPVERRPVDVDEVVADLLPMLERLVGDDVVLATDLNAGGAHVLADPSAIEQAVVNLVVNAREAMPRGGRVEIATSASGECVVLEVRDDGPGIPAEIQERIFEPFFTTKESSGSSGLGLATVYAIVTQAGGSIRVDSSPGRGTAFAIELPRCDPARRADRAEPKAEPAALPVVSREILLVEDNVEVADSLAELLGAIGHRVKLLRSGEEAIAELETAADRYDLLVTDVVMPGASGADVAAAAWRARPRMPVLFLSGYTDRFSADALLAGGPSRLVEKPFTLVRLVEAMAELLPAEPDASHAARGPDTESGSGT